MNSTNTETYNHQEAKSTTQEDLLIDGLDVSDKWKAKFHFIALAGGPKLPRIKELDKRDWGKVSGLNLWAFIFGSLYYFFKGMWKRGIFLFVVGYSIAFFVAFLMLLMGWEKYISPAIGNAVVGTLFGMYANRDYYKKMVLKDNSCW